MNPKEIVYLYKNLAEKAISIANLYNTMSMELANKSVKGKPRRFYHPDCCWTSNPYTRFNGMIGDNFVCSFEYNSSCNCHPEYQDWEIELPVEWMDMDTESLKLSITKKLNEDIANNIADERRKNEE